MQQAKGPVTQVGFTSTCIFIPNEWLKAMSENFPGKKAVPGRSGFNGDEAGKDIRKHYAGARTPDSYRKRGASNPIKYTYR